MHPKRWIRTVGMLDWVMSIIIFPLLQSPLSLSCKMVSLCPRSRQPTTWIRVQLTTVKHETGNAITQNLVKCPSNSFLSYLKLEMRSLFMKKLFWEQGTNLNTSSSLPHVQAQKLFEKTIQIANKLHFLKKLPSRMTIPHYQRIEHLSWAIKHISTGYFAPGTNLCTSTGWEVSLEMPPPPTYIITGCQRHSILMSHISTC